VEVKYEVKGLKATARPTPMAVNMAILQSWTYKMATTNAQNTVKTLETS